jgi:hypothetical protein
MQTADMALGAGSLPEWFGICLRSDCSTVKMLRLRALRYFLKRGAASAAPSAVVVAADWAIRRIGYVSAEDVRGAVVKEYAELLRLDIPLSEDLISLFGGQPGWTLEELIYRSDDPLVSAFHEVAMALFMEYVERTDWRQLDALDFAAYATLELLRRGRMAKSRATELLKQITDQTLSAT